MTTQAQILANRRNSEKSTGPKTSEGKATVAQNATKHGLFARGNVVISEHQADFDALREKMFDELVPEGTMESLLAERIVSLIWRIKRTERMQNELIDVKIRREINDMRPELSESLITGKPCDKSKYSDKCYDDQVLGYIAMRDFGGSRALERLSLYERRFEASLFKTMAELKKLQQARKSEQAKAETVGYAIPKASGFEAATHRGRDARDIRCAKQSQFSAAQEELSPFEKKEYELLLGPASARNKANDSHLDTEIRGQSTEDREQKTAKRRRRETLPFDKLRTGVCRY